MLEFTVRYYFFLKFQSNSSEMKIELMHSPEDRGVPFELAQRAVSVLSVNNWDVTLNQTEGPHAVVMDELNLILSDLGLLKN